ncbi:sugar transferase [Geodermatophilus sp. SYSU D00758]
MVLGDLLCGCAATAAAVLTGFRPPAPGIGTPGSWAVLALPPLWVVGLALARAYARPVLRDRWVETGRVLVAAAWSAGTLAILWVLTGAPLATPTVLGALLLATPATLLVRRTTSHRLGGGRCPSSRSTGSPVGGPVGVAPPSASTAERLLAAFVATLLLPVLLLIGLAVRVTSRGPVLVRQLRHGSGGRPLRALRFRTTVAGSGTGRRASGGARTTRVGRLLRRLSLDELPRLLDVARGEMPLLRPGNQPGTR